MVLDNTDQHPFQHHIHTDTHHKHPSVPSSTRTVSTLSGEPQSAISPPTTYNSLRRQSKFTAFSGSSNSSTYSADSTRHHYTYGERPDISTVFEEEGGLDVDLNSEGGVAHNQRTISLAPPLEYRYPVHQTSSSTLITSINRQRNGTISSQNSGKSIKSVHPFANTSILTVPPTKSFLPSQHSGVASIASSRSHPNLAESYNMSAVAYPTPIAIVSSEAGKDDEDVCPICVESLSFTFRLPGEKPHVVPECGHALHEECFVVVYGEVPPEGSRRQLGVCGVCRQPMRIAEGGGKKFRAKNSKYLLLYFSIGSVLI